ncbi:Alcohol dehydrogenase superfamily zinc-containing [Macrophomina phaseolina MS6]|uniref:Alcohol dehydrogenase superfamily zinc-containing n=1 Tax=Macrophomina phaseolina (strain MS6) TaxID=1126212 RepID=K2RMY6_MACPH|nr:Alcohol dehydrogenase superfamily zinc-containing [Macrophomina phaseolina MS6]
MYTQSSDFTYTYHSHTMANRAAWITAVRAKPLKVDSAPYPKAGPGEVVIKNSVVAINHVDWKIQDFGFLLEQYPNVLGADVAGVVEEVGPGVTLLKKGDRIAAMGHGLQTQNPAHGGFQHYTAVLESIATPIPHSMNFEDGVVLPIAVSTAAGGLYHKDKLALPLPSHEPTPSGKTILVWGGSSAVGSMAIQLAVASGVRVVATASSHNHKLVGYLGANAAVDYKSPNAVNEILLALQEVGGEFAGVYDAISEGDSFDNVGAVVRKLGGAKVVNVLPPHSPPEGFQPSVVFATDVLREENKGVLEAVWAKFLPGALTSHQLKAFPEPSIIGEGLEAVQEGLEKLKAGVSAKKLVVKL